jgi:hypothetical protein
MNVLFLAANPRDMEWLALDVEVTTIKERLSASPLRDEFALRQEWAVRLTEISRHLMEARPTIVHFSGHGSHLGELIFQDASGSEGATASKEAIADLFRILKDDIRLVVLNACYTEDQARAIAEHIDCVIGTSSTIEDQASLAFAGGFYAAIGFNRDILTAFELGRNAIDLSGGHRGLPQLVTRQGVDPGTIHLFAERPAPSPAPTSGLSVLHSAHLEETEVGNVSGAVGGGGQGLPDQIDVLAHATIRRSKLGDVTGIDLRRPDPEKAP